MPARITCGLILLLAACLVYGVEVRPEINGTFDQTCIDNLYPTCDPRSGSPVPSGESQGLVQLAGSHQHLIGWRVMDSAARGIFFASGSTGTTGKTGNRIIDVYMENVWNSNTLHLGWEHDYWIIRDSTFLDAGYRYSYPWYTSAAGCYNNPDGGFQCIGGGFSQFRGSHEDQASGPSYGIFEGNTVCNNSGELGFFELSHAIIRGNLFCNIRNTGLYLDNAAKMIAEWNVLYSASDHCDIERSSAAGCATFSNGDAVMNSGRLQIEDHPGGCSTVAECTDTEDSEDNVVRNNLAVFASGFMGGGMESVARDVADLEVGRWIIANTVYRAGFSGWDEGTQGNGGVDWQSTSVVANNVHGGDPNVTGEGDSRCGPQLTAAGAYSYNVWTETQAELDDNCEGDGDEYGSEPTFASAATSLSAWDSPPSFADYVITGGNGNNSALDLTGSTIEWLSSDCSELPQLSDLDPSGGPVITWTPTCEHFRKLQYYDYQGNARGATSDKGF